MLKYKDIYVSRKSADAVIARQVELAVCGLDSLSVLPCVAAQYLGNVFAPHFSPSQLIEIICSSPALAARILSVIGGEGINWPNGKISLRYGLDRPGADVVRESVLSVRVCEDFGSAEGEVLSRKDLILHSLAVACCAEDIAGLASPEIDPQLAYFAGLLHDVGKLALADTMPRSFARIAEEAEAGGSCICSIEQKRLGVDHAILGKRLAQKWRLPRGVELGVWLHHSNTARISAKMPKLAIARLVQLADWVARRSGIGRSGSFDAPAGIEQLAASFSVGAIELDEIQEALPERVKQRSEILGLGMPKAAEAYAEVVHDAAVQLSRDNAKLSVENRHLQTASSHLDFIAEFLLSVDSATGAIDIAKSFAVRWQKFYQTGKVCVYLAPEAGSEALEAVFVENLAEAEAVVLDAPLQAPSIPGAIANRFAIVNAGEEAEWLFEQLEMEFERKQTKLMPLLSGGRAVAAVAFELRYPADCELFEDKFKMATSIAASVLDIALAAERQQRLAEQMVLQLGETGVSAASTAADAGLNALAEIAAGAAHELNSPLSVISGRAQLLATAETDLEKKEMLRQIQETAGRIANLMEDLMNFADPPQPEPAQTYIEELIGEAAALAVERQNLEKPDIRIEVAEGLERVYVDSGQVASAIASIICNAVESYGGEPGPVRVTVVPGEHDDLVRFQISDLGCGMDAETLRKAAQPFFSIRPAGRGRGMGLTSAQRLIRLNKGAVEMASKPGEGTTVTVLLPCRQTSETGAGDTRLASPDLKS